MKKAILCLTSAAFMSSNPALASWLDIPELKAPMEPKIELPAETEKPVGKAKRVLAKVYHWGIHEPIAFTFLAVTLTEGLVTYGCFKVYSASKKLDEKLSRP